MTVAALLAARGVSRAELARRGGPPPISLWRWETGRAGTPYRPTVERLARALEIPFDTALVAVINSIRAARAQHADAAYDTHLTFGESINA